MAQLVETTRIGNEPELRYTSGQNAQAAISLSLPCEYGKKDPQTNKRPTQWVDAAVWGKQAEALAPYLIKGQWVAVTLDDVHIEQYQSQGETRSKLVGRVSSLKLVGGAPQAAQQGQQRTPHPQESAARQPAPRPQQNQQAAPPAFDDFEDIPFAPMHHLCGA